MKNLVNLNNYYSFNTAIALTVVPFCDLESSQIRGGKYTDILIKNNILYKQELTNYIL